MSVQKQDHPSVKAIITGISGVGKSTLFERLIRRENARWVFLFDHKDGDLSRRFKVRPCFDADGLATATEQGEIVIFNPAKMFAGNSEAGFEWFCHWLWLAKSVLRGKKIFGSDELDSLVDERSKPGALCKILDQGRTFQIDCVFICQSMNAIHNQVRKQFTEIFAFRQGDANGTGWLADKDREWFAPEKLMTLQNGLWLQKNLSTGSTFAGGTAFAPKNSARDLRGL